MTGRGAKKSKEALFRVRFQVKPGFEQTPNPMEINPAALSYQGERSLFVSYSTCEHDGMSDLRLIGS